VGYGDRTFTFSVPDALDGAEDAGVGEDKVVAPIPGLVKIVKAVAGRDVAKGDALVVLEAMKMEHTLTAPRDGRIAEVMCAAGDLVQEGAVLVHMEA
jgi:3-methylcrotonyl-CoA carboxylase alpha subunit